MDSGSSFSVVEPGGPTMDSLEFSSESPSSHSNERRSEPNRPIRAKINREFLPLIKDATLLDPVGIYRDFAAIYVGGPYPQYSKWMARRLPSLLKKLSVRPKSVLDVACGEGSFAVAMAKRGYEVVGVDQSPDMLQLARKSAKREGVKVEFVRSDMRSLALPRKFDLVTCWYDSLNYLLKPSELQQTFVRISNVLQRDGFFIFDVNTVYALSVYWQRYPSNVQQDTQNSFEVHRPSYNARKKIATLRIVGFMRNRKLWRRIDEVHRERAYTLKEIRKCLRAAGLTERVRWGSIRKLTPPTAKTGRVWFVTQRRNQSIRA